MGLFDSVYVKCRHCEMPIEFQSKAGECYLNNYTLETAPKTVLGDLDGEREECLECGTVNEIETTVAARVK